MAARLSKLFSLENLTRSGFKVLLILVGSFVVYEVGKWIINRLLRLTVPAKRIHTLAILLQNLLKYFIFFVAVVMVLRELGVDPIPIVAGASVVGIALGIGAQSLVRDVVSGFFTLFEGVYAVGDFVCLHLTGAPDVFGLVEEIGLRATKIAEIGGAVSTIPNGIISDVDRYPLGYIPYFINLVMPADLGKEKVKTWLDNLIEDLPNINRLLVEKPKISEGLDLKEGKILARIKVGIIPSAEEEIKSISEYIGARFKQAFDVDISPLISYKLSEGAFEKYRHFFSVP